MSRFDPYLRNYVESSDGKRLRSEIAEAWESIDKPPPHKAIARSLAVLKLASQTNDRVLMAEACRLVAHSLNADEQYEPSIEYYQKAIALFEGAGLGELAAQTRLGSMVALYMTGKYEEAATAAAASEQWFSASNDLSGLASQTKQSMVFTGRQCRRRVTFGKIRPEFLQ